MGRYSKALCEFCHVSQPLRKIIRNKVGCFSYETFVLLLTLNSNIKAWFPLKRLTYSQVHSYENKYNLIGGNALNNLKKINLATFREIIRLFSSE